MPKETLEQINIRWDARIEATEDPQQKIQLTLGKSQAINEYWNQFSAEQQDNSVRVALTTEFPLADPDAIHGTAEEMRQRAQASQARAEERQKAHEAELKKNSNDAAASAAYGGNKGGQTGDAGQQAAAETTRNQRIERDWEVLRTGEGWTNKSQAESFMRMRVAQNLETRIRDGVAQSGRAVEDQE